MNRTVFGHTYGYRYRFKQIFCWDLESQMLKKRAGSGSIIQWYGLMIRIRTKMPRIRNTGLYQSLIKNVNNLKPNPEKWCGSGAIQPNLNCFPGTPGESIEKVEARLRTGCDCGHSCLRQGYFWDYFLFLSKRSIIFFQMDFYCCSNANLHVLGILYTHRWVFSRFYGGSGSNKQYESKHFSKFRVNIIVEVFFKLY